VLKGEEWVGCGEKNGSLPKAEGSNTPLLGESMNGRESIGGESRESPGCMSGGEFGKGVLLKGGSCG
jgi:hypothetical protein